MPINDITNKSSSTNSLRNGTSQSSRKRGRSAQEKKAVSFSTVQVRVHEFDLGDHPGCSSGPPLTLSWGHFLEFTSCIEDYEQGRELIEANQGKRKQKELIMSRCFREEVVLSRGYSRVEMNKVTIENMLIQSKQMRGIMKFKKKKKVFDNLMGLLRVVSLRNKRVMASKDQ